MSDRAGSLPLVGGALCLDYCNTVSGVGTAGMMEHIGSLGDLAAWSVHAGILSGPEAGRLVSRGTQRDHPEGLESALVTRTVLQEVFGRVAKGAVPGRSSMAALNTMLRASGAETAIVPSGGGFAWSHADRIGSLASVLNPILRSAADVLVHRELHRLKACPGRGCGWLFYDETKNANRVWCEMRVCGSRAKSRDRYKRQQDRSALVREGAAADHAADGQ